MALGASEERTAHQVGVAKLLGCYMNRFGIMSVVFVSCCVRPKY